MDFPAAVDNSRPLSMQQAVVMDDEDTLKQAAHSERECDCLTLVSWLIVSMRSLLHYISWTRITHTSHKHCKTPPHYPSVMLMFYWHCSYITMFGLFCLELSPEKPDASNATSFSGGFTGKKLLVDKREGLLFKKQHLKSHSSNPDSNTCASNREWKIAANVELPSDIQPVDQKDSSVDVPGRIVLTLSSGISISEQKTKTQSKVKKQVGSKHKTSSSGTQVTGIGTSLSLNRPGKGKKLAPNKDNVDTLKEKPQLNVAKHIKRKSEGHDNRDDTNEESLTVDIMSALVLDQPRECNSMSVDKGGSVTVHAQKMLSKVKSHESSKNERLDTGDGSFAETTVIGKGDVLSSSLPHEQKKSSNKGKICVPSRKLPVKVTKDTCQKSCTEEHTENSADTETKATDNGAVFHPNQPRCKMSSGNDGMGLSRQKSQTKVKKRVCSNSEVHGVRESHSAVISEAPDTDKTTGSVSRRQMKCRNLSFDSERIEQLKNLWKEMDSGLRCHGSCPPLSEGPHHCSKPSKSSENATEMSVPKTQKATTGGKNTREATTSVRSDVGVHSKHKQRQYSICDPRQVIRNRQNYSGIYASVEVDSGLSQHYKIPHQQQLSKSTCTLTPLTAFSEHTAAKTADPTQTGKSRCKVSSSGTAVSNNYSPLSESVSPLKYTDKCLGHEIDHVPSHSEKPKNKVLSLADYRTRKSDLKPSVPVTSSMPTNITQGDPLYMTSSLAEKLIISYTERSKTAGDGHEPQHSVDITDAHEKASVVKQTDKQSDSDKVQSFDGFDMLKAPVQSILPAVQQKRAAEVSSMNTSHMVYDTKDDQVLLSSCNTERNQPLVGNNLSDTSYSIIEVNQSNYGLNVAETVKIEPACSSDLSLESSSCEKVSGSFDVPVKPETAAGGDNIGCPTSHSLLLPQAADLDVKVDDRLQFASVGNQAMSAESLLDGSHSEFTASLVEPTGDSKFEIVAEKRIDEEIRMSLCYGTTSIPPELSTDVIDQAVDQASLHSNVISKLDDADNLSNSRTEGLQHHTEHKPSSPVAVECKKETVHDVVPSSAVNIQTEDAFEHDDLQDSLVNAKLLVFKAKRLVCKTKQDMKTQTVLESADKQHCSRVNDRTSDSLENIQRDTADTKKEGRVEDIKPDATTSLAEVMTHSEMSSSDMEKPDLGMYVLFIVNDIVDYITIRYEVYWDFFGMYKAVQALFLNSYVCPCLT